MSAHLSFSPLHRTAPHHVYAFLSVKEERGLYRTLVLPLRPGLSLPAVSRSHSVGRSPSLACLHAWLPIIVISVSASWFARRVADASAMEASAAANSLVRYLACLESRCSPRSLARLSPSPLVSPKYRMRHGSNSISGIHGVASAG